MQTQDRQILMPPFLSEGLDTAKTSVQTHPIRQCSTNTELVSRLDPEVQKFAYAEVPDYADSDGKEFKS